MNKPKPIETIRTKLFYNECIEYLEDKYKFKSRDFAGAFNEPRDHSKPYLDFWHFILAEHEYISNGSFFVIYTDEVEHLSDDDFRRIIYNYFFEEFSDQVDDGAIEFWVEW